MKHCEFEADLTPPEAGIGPEWPRVRFNFDNGWSASLVLRGTLRHDLTRYPLAAVAACPTDQWGRDKTELGSQEAFADEAIAFLAEVAARPNVGSTDQ